MRSEVCSKKRKQIQFTIPVTTLLYFKSLFREIRIILILPDAAFEELLNIMKIITHLALIVSSAHLL